MDETVNLSRAVADLVDSLAGDQRVAALAPFDDAGRREWSYLPGERAGLGVADLESEQHTLLMRVVAATVSTAAFAQVATIMALEDVLDLLEGGSRGRRRGQYWLACFGHPAALPWGLRFEGHHVSVNVTAGADGSVCAPLFLGANPATVTNAAGTPVVEPLHAEQHLALELLAVLDPEQRAQALVSDRAPADILTRMASHVDATLEPRGLSGASLAGRAAELLAQLVDVYVGRLPAAQARRRRPATADVWFAWQGLDRPGRPHYYRLQAPGLLIEYDNTQNDANHIHTVLRDPSDDFGGRLLADHYAASH